MDESRNLKKIDLIAILFISSICSTIIDLFFFNKGYNGFLRFIPLIFIEIVFIFFSCIRLRSIKEYVSLKIQFLAFLVNILFLVFEIAYFIVITKSLDKQLFANVNLIHVFATLLHLLVVLVLFPGSFKNSLLKSFKNLSSKFSDFFLLKDIKETDKFIESQQLKMDALNEELAADDERLQNQHNEINDICNDIYVNRIKDTKSVEEYLKELESED